MEGKQRNYGIDLLRILAMLGVVFEHVQMYGGITEHGGTLPWLFQAVACGAVDCFALISGYAGYASDGKRTVSRVLQTWLAVVFYNVLFTFIGGLCRLDEVNTAACVHAFFPVTYGAYWYVSAWLPAALLAPFLNEIVRSLPLRALRGLMALLAVAVFVYYDVVYYLISLGSDLFCLGGGYSMWWIAALYLAGAWMRREDFAARLPAKGLRLAGLLGILLSFGSRLLVPRLTERMTGVAYGGSLLLNYTSIATFAFCFGAVILFARKKIAGPEGLIRRITPCVFGVYLIHDHPLVRQYLMRDRFVFLTEHGVVLQTLGVFAAAVGIFLACMAAEWLRLQAFRLIRIPELCTAAGRGVMRLHERLTDALGFGEWSRPE